MQSISGTKRFLGIIFQNCIVDFESWGFQRKSGVRESSFLFSFHSPTDH
jgi:hypothetical protein